tara:strand:- start:986 stop:1120 length:135 start_codon:yes stop_codon:yes gene_type:complete
MCTTNKIKKRGATNSPLQMQIRKSLRFVSIIDDLKKNTTKKRVL